MILIYHQYILHDENYKKEIVAYITLAFSYCSIMILTLVILKTNFKDLYISLLFLIYLVLFFYFLISKVIFYKKPLKREQLIDQFVEAYFDENTAPVHISILLINIKNELLNNHTYKSDKRFITDGKLDFIENKIKEELKNKNLAKAIVNLYNYINFNSNLSQEYTVNQKLLEDWQKYYEDGIICEEEKNKIMSLVNIIDCYLKELKTNGGSK